MKPLSDILSIINPVDRIISEQELRALLVAEDRHTLVQKKFYHELPAIFEDLKLACVDGNVVQAGVWKGGSAAYIQALIQSYNTGSELYLLDTFNGFVAEEIKHPKDKSALEYFSDFEGVEVSPQVVKELFLKCGLPLDNLHIYQGNLKDTAQKIKGPLSLLHIDVDFYEPTYCCLEMMFFKLQKGGYVIIDDYGVEMFDCKEAVDTFRHKYGIKTPVQMMTDLIAYWKIE